MAQLNTPVIELVKMLDPPIIDLVTVSDNALESWTMVSPFGRLDECAKFIIGDTEDAFALEDVATAGKEYTLSFWLKSDAAGYVRTTGGGTFKASADWVKCVSTFTAEETGLSFSFDTPGEYYIYNTQLELGNKATDYRPATEDVDEGISNAQKAAEEARAKAEASGKALEDFLVGDFAKELAEINNQLDKKAETWYQDTDPALLWDTDEKKAAHAGDIWYDTVNKKSFIYMYTQSETEPPETEAPPEGQLAAPFITITSYGWHESDGVPQEVYDKIDGKAQIFSSQPTHPYYVEDLWVQPAVVDEEGNEIEPAGEIMICIEKSTPAGFNEAHWAPASRYIGQAELTNWIEHDYADDLKAINRQLDGKSETWCQSTDPSLEWEDEATRQLHVGDLWLDPTTKETYIYTASGPLGEPTPVDGKLATPYIVLYSWEPTFEIPQEVFDRIDGKAQMFTEKPEKDYFVGDLYIEELDEDGDREIYKCVKDYDPKTADFDTDWAPVIDGKHLIKKINLSADEFQIEAKKINLIGKVKAEHIDTEDLFAQDIEATGSITGMTFISEGKLTEENLPPSMPNLALILNEAKMEASNSLLTFFVGESEAYDHLKTEHTGFGSQYTAKSEDDLGLPWSDYAEQSLGVSSFGIVFQGRKAGASDFETIFSVERNGAYWKGSKLVTEDALSSKSYLTESAFEGYLSEDVENAVLRAVEDGAGNVITDTYLLKEGDTITGDLLFKPDPDLESVNFNVLDGSLFVTVGNESTNTDAPGNTMITLSRMGNFYPDEIQSTEHCNIGKSSKRWQGVYAKKGNFSESVKSPSFQGGRVNIDIETADTPTKVSVTFDTPYSSKPIVVATPYSTVPGSIVSGVSVYNITTTGFDLYLTRSNKVQSTVAWFAYGV